MPPRSMQLVDINSGPIGDEEDDDSNVATGHFAELSARPVSSTEISLLRAAISQRMIDCYRQKLIETVQQQSVNQVIHYLIYCEGQIPRTHLQSFIDSILKLRVFNTAEHAKFMTAISTAEQRYGSIMMPLPSAHQNLMTAVSDESDQVVPTIAPQSNSSNIKESVRQEIESKQILINIIDILSYLTGMKDYLSAISNYFTQASEFIRSFVDSTIVTLHLEDNQANKEAVLAMLAAILLDDSSQTDFGLPRGHGDEGPGDLGGGGEDGADYHNPAFEALGLLSMQPRPDDE